MAHTSDSKNSAASERLIFYVLPKHAVEQGICKSGCSVADSSKVGLYWSAPGVKKVLVTKNMCVHSKK